MQGLYYPAVLGTGLVLLISRITTRPSLSNIAGDISIYFGILILIYFSASFLVNDSTLVLLYGPAAFLLDVIEIVLIFLMFYFLGFDPSNPGKPDLRNFYLSLAFIPALQELWNWATEHNHFYGLSVPATVILLVGVFWGFHYQYFNVLMVGFVTVLIGVYFLKSK